MSTLLAHRGSRNAGPGTHPTHSPPGPWGFPNRAPPLQFPIGGSGIFDGGAGVRKEAREPVSWEYLHLISHSFPIVLSASAALVGVAGWVLNREDLERWALFALLVAGVFVIPAYLTGLAAADVVGERTFVQPSVVQRHRTYATFACVPLLMAAILAGFSFAEAEDRKLRRFVILVGVVAAILTGYAAYLGARIQHHDERGETTAVAGGTYSSETPGAKP